ncbi:MAG: ComF family protein [Candidatus Buchananbacteria bacterium]
MAVKSWLAKIKQECLEILFPASCVNCGQEGKWLCAKCFNLLSQILKFYCPACQQLQKVNHQCLAKPINYLDGLWFLGNYSQPIWQNIIASFKYNFIQEVADLLGQKFKPLLLANDFSFKNFIVVPVPLHPKRYLWRTFNQAYNLAINFFEPSQVQKVLQRQRYTKPQAQLKHRSRFGNITKAFVLVKAVDLVGRDILLIDDVYTTGSTMQECAKVLKQAGVGKVFGLVLAKG